MLKPSLGLLGFALLTVGCSGNGVMNGAADMSPPPDMTPPPPLGMPIVAPMNAWTWVDFPDSSCDDGSATGIGINPAPGKNLLVFLNGGGACWDYLTCFALNTAVHGPYGKTQFDAGLGGGAGAGTIFDRNEPKNPFKDYSFVFIPYCTGDVHAGDNIATYTDKQSGKTKTYHHAGHANVMAYLKRLGATFPSVNKLVVSGSSAGGFGASLNYDAFRSYWPSPSSYLLDDSGPALEGAAVPQFYKDAWFASWRLDKVLDPLCGAICRTDFSAALKLLTARFPKDRLALLSSLQDRTIRSYFTLSPAGFQTELLMVAADILDPSPNFRYFFVPGETHTMLGDPASFSSQGLPLWDWLTQLVTDDTAWKSTKP